jgi:predicted Rdx family selenoprotein
MNIFTVRFKVGGYYCHEKSGIVMWILGKHTTFFWGECFVAEVNVPLHLPELRAVSIKPDAVKGWLEIERQEFIERSAAMADQMGKEPAAAQVEDNFMRDIAGVRDDPATGDKIVLLVCGHTLRWGIEAKKKDGLKPGAKIFCEACRDEARPKLKVVT